MLQEEDPKAYEEELRLFELLDHNKEPKLSNSFDDLLEQKILQKEVEQEIKSISPVRRVLGIAASIVFVMGIIWYNWPEAQLQQIVQHSEATPLEIELPDGTVVQLNENSSISYYEDFGETSRKVELTGEAYFDVQRDEQKPFVITAGNSLTTVLGTAFNIRNRTGEESIVITVTHGKVSFASHENELQEQVFLTKDQQAIYKKNENLIQKLELTNLNNLHWKTGQLKFESSSVDQVLNDLRRAYQCDIEVGSKEILTCPFTGNFEDESIDEIIQVLAFSLNLKVNKTQNSFKLEGKGCQIPM